MDNMNKGDLNSEVLMTLSKEKLVEMFLSLKDECVALKEMDTYRHKMDKRMEEIEREQYKSAQYSRRDTVEITGIPGDIPTDALENEVIRIYDVAQVNVNGTKLRRTDIQACHRVGKRKTVIVKFVNRKFANEGLYCGKHLKNNSPYAAPTYINNSFCPEFRFLNYLVRQAKRAKKIHFYKVRHGVTHIQLVDSGPFHEVTHKADLVRHGICEVDEN